MLDVLIIGSGGAALSCAYWANKRGLTTFIASKTAPTWSQTTQAQGGINAAIAKDDTPNLHIQDTLNAALGLADEASVTKLVQNAKDTIAWLDSIGVVFNKDEKGGFMQRRLGGASKKRALFCQDYTGLKIMHALFDHTQNIPRSDSYFLVDLITLDGVCRGALFFDFDARSFETVYAKNVVLATGGYGGIYHGYTTNSEFATGDAVAAANKAGAFLRNMEFVQFHPTALKNSKVLISESARGEGGYLINSKNERFVDELSSRDKVSQAIFRQIQAGEEVFLDIRHLGETFVNEFMPQEYKLAKLYENVDALKEPIPVVPAAHYSMGGIGVDENFQTNIQNLYAVGECSESKIHGANRLGGNSLLEITVFGKLLGQSLRKDKPYKEPAFDFHSHKQAYEKSKSIQEGVSVRKLKKQLGEILNQDVGIYKTQSGLKRAKTMIKDLQTQVAHVKTGDGKGYTQLLELQNAITTAQLVVEASLNRTQSLGAHAIGANDE